MSSDETLRFNVLHVGRQKGWAIMELLFFCLGGLLTSAFGLWFLCDFCFQGCRLFLHWDLSRSISNPLAAGFFVGGFVALWILW